MTVIDSFVVELGLDASKFTAGQRAAYEAAKKMEQGVLSSAKNIEHGAGKAGDAISGIRTQALELFAVFAGGKGVIEFTNNLIHANGQLGRLERNIGVSASTISKWQGVARIFGGDAATMAASFTSISDAFAGWKIGMVTPLIADLRAISTAGGKIIDVNKGVEQSYLDLAENLRNINARDPATAGLLGRKIGLDPALFDAMISGNLQKVLDLVQKIGVATSADADAFGELEKRMGMMGLKAESIGRKALGNGEDGSRGLASIFVALADEMNKPASEAKPWDAIFGWGEYAKGGGGGKLLGPNKDAMTSSRAWRTAIGNIESRGSGGYGAIGPTTRSGDRAYGRYQVMGNNIGPWSEAALGRRISAEEFLASPELQDKIFDHRFGQYVKQFGNPQDAASAWFTGRPQAQGAGARDVLGTSGADYVRKFNAEGGNVTSSSTKTDVHIGTVNVTAPAGSDPETWANRFRAAVERQSYGQQAAGGQQ